MPVWLHILVSIALKLGMPWLLKMFPWIPESVIAELQKLIDALSEDKKAHRASRANKIRSAKVRIQRSCALGVKKCT